MNMATFVATADRMLKTRNRAKEVMYIVLLPNVSLKLLHQSGKILMLSIYKATLKFIIVGEELKVFVMSVSPGKMIDEPIGAAAAASATMTAILAVSMCF